MDKIKQVALKVFLAVCYKAKTYERFVVNSDFIEFTSSDNRFIRMNVRTVCKSYPGVFAFDSLTFKDTTDVVVIDTPLDMFVINAEKVKEAIRLCNSAKKNSEGLWVVNERLIDFAGYYRFVYAL